MKRAPWYVAAGAAAGFVGVIGLYNRPAVPVSLSHSKSTGGGASQPQPAASPAASGAGPAAGPVPGGPARSATGSLEQYGYGELDVKVTVAGSHITGVTVPLLRTAEPYSQQLAQQVIPMLRSEVMSAQSAHINGITGATYTAEAYAISVQAALDKLHVK